MIDERQIYLTILELLELGDQDQQPWAFYEHDHGGLKGFNWTREQAMSERNDFAHAVVRKIQETER